MKFELGQQVIALTNPLDNLCQQRIKGNIYKVTSIIYCPVDGSQSINIDNQILAEHKSNMTKCDCGQEHANYGLQFTYSHHFISLTEDSIELLSEQEEYELCSIIRDYLNKDIKEST